MPTCQSLSSFFEFSLSLVIIQSFGISPVLFKIGPRCIGKPFHLHVHEGKASGPCWALPFSVEIVIVPPGTLYLSEDSDNA